MFIKNRQRQSVSQPAGRPTKRAPGSWNDGVYIRFAMVEPGARTALTQVVLMSLTNIHEIIKVPVLI